MTSLTEQALVVGVPSLQLSAPGVDVWSLSGAPAGPSSVSLLLDRMAPSWKSREMLTLSRQHAPLKDHGGVAS